MDGLKEIGRERGIEAEMNDFNEWMKDLDGQTKERTNKRTN